MPPLFIDLDDSSSDGDELVALDPVPVAAAGHDQADGPAESIRLGYAPSVILGESSEDELLQIGPDVFAVDEGGNDALKSSMIQFHDEDAIPEALEKPLPLDESEIVQAPLASGAGITVDIPGSTLAFPKSQCQDFVPPVPVVSERRAVADLWAVEEAAGRGGEDFAEFELDQFCFYSISMVGANTDASKSKALYDLRPLQHLGTKSGAFLFDGILRNGEVQHYVRGMTFEELPIGNYGVSEDTVGDQIWIRSKLNRQYPIYYKLGKPAFEYARYHNRFLWIADLTKHFIDYCEKMANMNRAVTLSDFRGSFSAWLRKTHKQKPAFQKWYRMHGSDDFRGSIVANQKFLWKEINGGTIEKRKMRWLRIFKEIRHFSQYAKLPPSPDTLADVSGVRPTIVTPYIHRCFGDMQLGTVLRRVEPSSTVQKAEFARAEKAAHTQSFFKHARGGSGVTREEMIAAIKPGDTISTHQDDPNSGSRWVKLTPRGAVEDDDRWFGLVQQVHVSKRGHRTFDISWMYRPVDTPCCTMNYLWQNELFLSEHCTCMQDSDAKIHEEDILTVHSVEWFGNPETQAEFFVRQTYQTEDRRWITLRHAHLKCHHSQQDMPPYNPGDTVLAKIPGTDPRFLEPVEVERVYKDGKYVVVRKLLRRGRVDPSGQGCPPNELVYTDRIVKISLSSIEARCLVRFFKSGDSIPVPYSRNGTGNAFYITHREIQTDHETKVVPLDAPFPSSMRQGFDPSQRHQKLRGLDLYCGGGNFGRGLEEGGAVGVKWANDIWDIAVHTYMANVRGAHSAVKPTLGSVDDMLLEALRGNFSAGIPSPGEVDFISGGSPCQGFSLLTTDKDTAQQVKNQSMVASFASFVDLYRPKYGILENVPSIVQSHKSKQLDEDVFSQLICAVLGMSYQVQIILGDAWSFGAPQGRSRVFLLFAAPGLRLPSPPVPSHAHPPAIRGSGIGRMSNGEPYVERELRPTAFDFVSAGAATADLPDVWDSMADACTPFPDHRTKQGHGSHELRTQIALIPTQPYGMSFGKAWAGGGPSAVMLPAQRLAFPAVGERVQRISKAWMRIDPGQLFSTVSTTSAPADGRVGRMLHWRQPRPLTLMEVRRAQGFPDHEVLLGKVSDQWRIVGNSVSRHMALALGLCIREAWIGSLYDDDQGDCLTDAAVAPKVGSGMEDSIVVALAEELDEPDKLGNDVTLEDEESASLKAQWEDEGMFVEQEGDIPDGDDDSDGGRYVDADHSESGSGDNPAPFLTPLHSFEAALAVTTTTTATNTPPSPYGSGRKHMRDPSSHSLIAGVLAKRARFAGWEESSSDEL